MLDESRKLRKFISFFQISLCTTDPALHEKCPNTEFFLVRTQSEYGKIRTRKNAVIGHFSRSAEVAGLDSISYLKSQINKIYRLRIIKPTEAATEGGFSLNPSASFCLGTRLEVVYKKMFLKMSQNSQEHLF